MFTEDCARTQSPLSIGFILWARLSSRQHRSIVSAHLFSLPIADVSFITTRLSDAIRMALSNRLVQHYIKMFECGRSNIFYHTTYGVLVVKWLENPNILSTFVVRFRNPELIAAVLYFTE